MTNWVYVSEEEEKVETSRQTVNSHSSQKHTMLLPANNKTDTVQ